MKRTTHTGAHAIGIVVSAAIHGLVLALPLRFIPARSSPATIQAPPAGMRVVNLRPDRTEPVVPVRRTPPEQPPRRTEPDPAAAAPDNVSALEAAVAPVAESVTRALTIRTGDARLWRRPVAPLIPIPPVELANARVATGTLKMVADSIAAAEEAARRATDWTLKGAGGEQRWGVSPDCIHIAGHARCQSTGKRADEVERDYLREATQRAAMRMVIEERIEAIRLRRDSVRARKKAGGSRER
jgi:hypothetical protein